MRGRGAWPQGGRSRYTTAIYFGILAREAHGDLVHATHADRDNISADDYVQILLDTYNDRRRAFCSA